MVKVSKETGRQTDNVQEEVSAILDEMAHSLQLSTVRFFAFTLSKIFKSLFKSIRVNEEGIQRVRIQIRHWTLSAQCESTQTQSGHRQAKRISEPN